MIDKESASILSALGLILSGIILVFCAFFRSEDGVISDSVLWYVGEALLYAGSVFGLKSYIDYKLKKQ